MKPFKCSATEERQRERNACKHRREMGEPLRIYKFIRTFVLPVPREKMQALFLLLCAQAVMCCCQVIIRKCQYCFIFAVCFSLHCVQENGNNGTHVAYLNSIRIASYLIHFMKENSNTTTTTGKITGISEICIDVATYRWI